MVFFFSGWATEEEGGGDGAGIWRKRSLEADTVCLVPLTIAAVFSHGCTGIVSCRACVVAVTLSPRLNHRSSIKAGREGGCERAAGKIQNLLSAGLVCLAPLVTGRRGGGLHKMEEEFERRIWPWGEEIRDARSSDSPGEPW